MNITNLTWHTPPRCANGACVATAVDPATGDTLVRDTKDPNGPVLRFTQLEWAAFVAHVRAGGQQ